MKIKGIIVASVITFLLGTVGGGAAAYVNHPANGGHGMASLSEDIKQAHENREIEQFIDQQEKLRPDGLEESKIEAGSKYTGITYNGPNHSVVIATQPKEQGGVSAEQGKSAETSSSFFDSLRSTGKKTTEVETETRQEVINGRVAIQTGSLNIRDKAGTDGAIIGAVYKNETVQITGQSSGWYQVITANGLQGYVSATYIEIIE